MPLHVVSRWAERKTVLARETVEEGFLRMSRRESTSIRSASMILHGATVQSSLDFGTKWIQTTFMFRSKTL